VEARACTTAATGLSREIEVLTDAQVTLLADRPFSRIPTAWRAEPTALADAL